ncbi:S-adenosylmethionine decarboxylase [Desulfocicer vacuolatum DSM 3385]|uniref:S-adenosylmethionine decarboxylase proenzyme n=1 Tax=Desulfocicer vacuolatum DSM 3385 TaxID=1121400 RepID=A0A1W2A2L3_9BACT|nr:adenosylmethionine decarboxylase [Desulfocicer vacuolatum]SMC54969.1 S-adenosylmethionine decarboxylase [Desulfocicer vacuolatum DSM 3385]
MSHSRKKLKERHAAGGLTLGRQLTIDYYNCRKEALGDCDALEKAFVDAARSSGATVISSSFHAFNPQGVSGVVIIAESHFTVHVWPEHRYAAVDIFSCGEHIDMERAKKTLQEFLGAGKVVVSSDMGRGIF